MNSKAIKRQLLAAIAMVLVAAIALGSSTYAWFVASGTVKAEGMKVQAQADSGILIKELNKTGAVFGTVATVSENTAMLYPTSTNDLSKWYSAKSERVNAPKYKVDGNTTTYASTDYTHINKTSDADLPKYVFVKEFAIRSATSTELEGCALAIKKVEVSPGTKSQNFNTALRVGVKVNNGKPSSPNFFVYAPNSSRAFTLEAGYLAADETGITEKTAAPAISASTGDKLALLNNTIPATDAGLSVLIYVWYEGEDDGCMTQNIIGSDSAIEIDELSVSVTFEKYDIPSGS